MGLFDRAYQWRGVSLETEKKKNTLLLGCNGKTLLTAKMPKNTQKLRFWFLGGFLIKEHRFYPHKHSIREGVPG